MQDRINALPEFLKPRLRLYMSVDIVGSTAMKQGLSISDVHHGPNHEWFQLLSMFYRNMEVQFAKHWADKSQKARAEFGECISGDPELWKAIGDEVVYTKCLTSQKEAVVCVAAWLAAVEDFRGQLKGGKFPDLDLKCTLWLAGFPVTNTEVVLQAFVGTNVADTDSGNPIVENGTLLNQRYSDSEDFDKSNIRDFVGPSIDLGFRLGTLSTPRKCILSLELAHLLLNWSPLAGSPFSIPVVRYDGRVALKGIMSGAPYPVFWLDLGHKDSLLVTEDKLLGHAKDHQESAMRDFCHGFMAKHPKYFTVPFIVVGGVPEFGTLPVHYLERLEGMSAEWKLAKQKIETEESEGGEPKPPRDTEVPNIDVALAQFLSVFSKLLNDPPK